MTDCELVLRILKDHKLHRNFDIFDILGGGFALAARVWDLRKPKGKYKLHIESGPPKKFGKVRIKEGDWYYQLTDSIFTNKSIKEVGKVIFHKPDYDYKPLTREFMKTHSKKLDRILA